MHLAKQYDPKAVEPRLYARWEQSGYFHEEPDPARPPFIICMPPPNVTARAHLGHGSTYPPMDVLTRYHRMLGENADWLPGLDHAAIATEAVLLKKIAAEGLTREGLGRERFLERAWEWSRTYGREINDQFRVLGFGPDWKRERFTMDDALSAAVRNVFVRLYREGLIYRGKRLVNWDPKGKTTVSDAEVDHVERDAVLWHVAYPAVDGGDGVTIATTRPETILADIAIAVHPDDDRYAALVGRSVLVPPLLERSIPVIADAAVDPAFGTGAVKVTPAHDATDYEIGTRHGLPMPSVIGLDAAISASDVAVGPYEGLDRFEARARIVEDLRAKGLLVREEPHRHAIAVSERTGDVIEPLLSLQWFVRMESLAQPALQAYRDGRLRFVPERYGRTYEQWLTNIRDWNVSRQLWWGHQLPVWYTPDGTPVVAETEEEAREIALREHGTGDLAQDHRHARHVVFERPLAVLDPGVAEADAGTCVLVSVASDDHRVGDHLLVGRAHGHARVAPHRKAAVCERLHHAARLRQSRAQDVEVAWKRDRSARRHRQIRRRRVSHGHASADAPRGPRDSLSRVALRRSA